MLIDPTGNRYHRLLEHFFTELLEPPNPSVNANAPRAALRARSESPGTFGR
jgi:hypothetical protein